MTQLSEKELKKRMESALEALTREFAGLRSGRANPALLEPVQVEAYGGHMPLKEVAGISAPEPRMLSVSVWDQGLVKSVERGISEANLGLNPSSDGNIVRVYLPELSEESRRDLVKVAHKYAEQARIAVRNVRRDGIDGLRKAQKAKEIGEDVLRRGETDIQKLTDDYTGKVNSMLKAKETEIMQI